MTKHIKRSNTNNWHIYIFPQNITEYLYILLYFDILKLNFRKTTHNIHSLNLSPCKQGNSITDLQSECFSECTQVRKYLKCEPYIWLELNRLKHKYFNTWWINKFSPPARITLFESHKHVKFLSQNSQINCESACKYKSMVWEWRGQAKKEKGLT